MPILFFSVVSRYLPRLIGLSLPILKIATWLKFPFFFYMSREVLLSPSLQMVAPTYSSYYSQGIYSENLFPHFPLHPWEAISNSSPCYSFILRPSSYEIWQSARTGKKMLKKLLPKTKSKKKKEAASSAIPTLDRLHEVWHPRCTKFFACLPCSCLLDLYFRCACVSSIVCRSPIKFMEV